MTEGFLGGFIAFICAAIAIGTDAQTEVRTRFGRVYGTSVFRSLWGYLFIIGWGLINVGFYVAFLYKHDWAQRAFNIDVDKNLLWTGLVVGLSAVLIIRTNLATVGSIQVGGEWAYLWSRSFLIVRLNSKRVQSRREFLTRPGHGHQTPCHRDLTGFPAYFDALEDELKSHAKALPQEADILQQLKTIRGTKANPNKDSTARKDLTALFYDYLGPTLFDSWAASTDCGNQ